MPRKQGVAILALLALMILAVVGSMTLIRTPEPARGPAPLVTGEDSGPDESELLRDRIAELQAQLREAERQRSASPAPQEKAPAPQTVAEVLDRAKGLSNSEKNAPERLRLLREVLDRSGHPNNRAQAYYDIAMTYSVLGRKADKLYYLQKALDTGADHPIRTSAAYYLSYDLHARGDVRGALHTIDEFLQDPRHHSSMIARAKAHKAKWLTELGE